LLDLWPSPFIILNRETFGTFHAFVTYKHNFLVGFAWLMSEMFVRDELKVFINIVLHVKDTYFSHETSYDGIFIIPGGIKPLMDSYLLIWPRNPVRL
jgi:hypothetical protein